MSLFPRQIVACRRGNVGQATVTAVVTTATILSLLLAVVYATHFGGEKVTAANSIDAIALSAATWEARGLNMIAALNDGILQCLRAIRAVCAVWAGMALLACTGHGIPAFVAYSKYARRVVRSYWRCARQLSDWSERVRSATPGLVLADSASLAAKLKVAGLLSPADPAGPHDGRNTLELHVRKGDPVGILDAMEPIVSARKRLPSGPWTRMVASLIDAVVRYVVGAEGEPIRLLEPEPDLPQRQRVRFDGAATAAQIPAPYISWLFQDRIFDAAAAEAYGGAVASMTWRSRLIDQGAVRGAQP